MLKIKLKDLELTAEYIKANIFSEVIDFEEENQCLSISFIDKNQKACKIFLWDSSRSITPEVRVTTKLYRSKS